MAATRKRVRWGRGLRCGAGVVLLVGAPAFADPWRWTEAERNDALEPWSLEAGAPLGPGPQPAPLPPADAPEVPGPAGRSEPQGPPTTAPLDEVPGGDEQVLIVRCRQVLVSDPSLAARLGRLLRAGVELEAARASLGDPELIERTREYAVDELEPEVGAELESVPVGGWIALRPWRGRSVLVQVLEREVRERRSLPRLGEGLDAGEKQRVAQLVTGAGAGPGVSARGVDPRFAARPGRLTTATVKPAPEVEGVVPVAFVEQAEAEYPEDAKQAGEVTVKVQVGLLGEVVEAQVVSTSDSAFDEAALDAARRSRYAAQTRNGIPEPGTIHLIFKFPAPQPRQD